MLRLVASVTGARIAASGIQALTLLALTRALGAAQFGQFATLTAICGVTVVVLGFGLSSVALRVSALEDSRNVATTVAMLRIPVSVFGAAVTFLGALVLFDDKSSLSIVFVATLYAAVEAMGMGVESVLYGLSRPGRAQVTLLCRRALMLVGIGLGLLMGDELAWFAGSIGLVFVLLGAPLIGLLSTPASVSRVLRLSIPFWSPTVLAKVQLLDVVVASLVMSPTAAGIYAAATRLTSPLNTFAVATLSVLTPRLASRFGSESKDDLFHRARKSMLLAAVTLIVLSPGIGWLTEYVLGPEYEGVIWIAAVMTCMTAIAALAQVYVSRFYANGDGSTVAKARLIVVPASLAIGAVLAYRFGPIGLGLAMLGSQVALWGILTLPNRGSVVDPKEQLRNVWLTPRDSRR